MKQNTTSAKGIGTGAIAGACVLVAVLCGLIYYLSFVRPASATEDNPKNAEAAWVAEKAVETQGDLSRLNPDDRARLEKVSAGHPAEALQMKWEAYQQAQARKAQAENGGR
ncbi:hypothetical protein EON81_03935 [bacterium]|nr:MAG: hypothetical protein EON81_03935 [bacterium]